MANRYPLPKRIIDAHNHVATATCDELLSIMDANRVELALVMGSPNTPNEEVLRCVRAHGDRLIGGAYVDPRHINRAVEDVKRWQGEGFRLIKLFPNLGYYPDEDYVQPMFETIAELKLAVLSHCGWLTPAAGVSAAYYSAPGRFEKVIRRHKDTIFILAHMGGMASFLETIMLTTRTPNTYCDCSPGQGTWVIENCPMAASIPPDRIMWGADSNGHAYLLKRCHAALAKLRFGPHMEKIFYSNARGLFERMGALPASPAKAPKAATPSQTPRLRRPAKPAAKASTPKTRRTQPKRK